VRQPADEAENCSARDKTNYYLGAATFRLVRYDGSFRFQLSVIAEAMIRNHTRSFRGEA